MTLEYRKPCVGSSLSEAAMRMQAADADCDFPVVVAVGAIMTGAGAVAAGAVQVYTVVTSR